MAQPALSVTFHGVRGSVPTPDAATLRYGGNTCCLEIAGADGERLIVDCGTGIRSVLAGRTPGSAGLAFNVLLTHFHSDHLSGLPFFNPLYDPRTRFTFHGVGWRGSSVQSLLEQAIRPPWFPLPFGETPAGKRYVDLSEDAEPFDVAGIRVTQARLQHPQGVSAFRLDRGGKSVVVATDYERGDAEADRWLRELARGTDILIHDAQYTPTEYERSHRGWGHSTWQHAVEVARDAGVGKLVLFHHDPERTDVELDEIQEQARQSFPNVDAAREETTLVVR